MTPIPLAIVGCGGISHRHVAAINALPDLFRVVSLSEPNVGALDRLAAKLPAGGEVKRVADVASVAADPDVQAAIVTLPHDLHESAVTTLLEAGKHVLVEKPFTHDAQQARRLVALAKRKKLHLAVGHMQRHSPVATALKKLIDAGDIGDVFGVHATALQHLPLYAAPDSGHWLYSAEKAGGGIVISVCVHKLDLMRHLFGEVAFVTALFEIDPTRSSPKRPFEWTAAVSLKFASGAVGNVFTCYKAFNDHWVPETLTILGNDGSIHTQGWEAFDIISRKSPAWARGHIVHKPTGEETWIAQARAFHAGITEGRPNIADAADAVGTMTLLDAIYESGLAGGAPVKPAPHEA